MALGGDDYALGELAVFDERELYDRSAATVRDEGNVAVAGPHGRKLCCELNGHAFERRVVGLIQFGGHGPW